MWSAELVIIESQRQKIKKNTKREKRGRGTYSQSKAAET